MIDTGPFPAPHLNSDVQNALSRKYSAQTISFIELPSGQIALMKVSGAQRSIWAIGDDAGQLVSFYLQETAETHKKAKEAEARLDAYHAQQRKREAEVKTLAASLDLGDFKL